MRGHRALLAAASLAAACTSPPHRVEFSAGYPVHDCPAQLDGQVRLHAEVRPLEPAARAPHAGAVARRLVISVDPAGLRAHDRIVWSSLTVATYGGTFLGWERLQTGTGSIVPGAQQPRAAAYGAGEEVATVAFAPGQLRIARIARGKLDLAGLYSIDVLLLPGGVAVEDTIVRIARLWHENGSPLPAAQVTPELVPVRHPPGLDVVEAGLELDFVIKMRDGAEWSCSAATPLTLVDRAALRQPFWDLGLASSNSARREWLALFGPALGGVRLVFDSPAAAGSLADWLRATRAVRLGAYELGVFSPSAGAPGRPLASIDATTLRSWRALRASDIDALAVGPAGEP